MTILSKREQIKDETSILSNSKEVYLKPQIDIFIPNNTNSLINLSFTAMIEDFEEDNTTPVFHN